MSLHISREDLNSAAKSDMLAVECTTWCIVLLFCYQAIYLFLQAEPLVIDLKDLFQLIFNMRKKEAEGPKKVSAVGEASI